MKSDSKKGKVVLSEAVTVEELPDTNTPPEESFKSVEEIVEPIAESTEPAAGTKKSLKTKAKSTQDDEPKVEEQPPLPDEEEPENNDDKTPEITDDEQKPEDAITPPQKKWKLTKPSKRTSIIAGSVVVGLAVLWLISGLLFSQTTIGNTKLSSRVGDEQFLTTLKKQVEDYRLSISYPDGNTKKYELSAMGISLDPEASVQATRKEQQKANRWIAWWNPVRAKLVFKEKPDVLKVFITKEIDVPVQPSKDASLTIEKGEITLTESVSGIHYSLQNPDVVIKKAAQNLQTESIKLEKLTDDPALSAELLKPYKDSLEKTLSQSIKFTIGDKTISPSTVDIASWLDITPDTKQKKLLITVNSGKVVEYIDKIAANAIRPPRSQVIVKKADGSEQVIVAGVRGLDVLNKGDVATTISKTLLENKGITVSLPVSYAPFKTISTGYYPKWIEADITNKRLYVHEYTETVKTILISAGAPATPTVTGQYAVGAKLASQDMRGRNVDGSNYFQPRVPWIMYFYNDYAIHGNYWRPLSYFGNVNSSHGCIGMTPADAAWLYDWTPKGTPVIVYK